MLRQRESIPKAKAVVTNIEVYDEKNNLIRIAASARTDSFTDNIELPDGDVIASGGLVPITLHGAETSWTEGEGDTVFVWDCRNELGETVKNGSYRIDIKQADSFGRAKTVSRQVNVTGTRAM